jgi:UDP-glucose 4-epimerase
MALYLVTGGAGFICSHIASALVARGDQVRVLDNLVTGRMENLASLGSGVQFVRGDITNQADVAGAMQGVHAVFHEAALASVPRSIERPLDTHAACATGTLIVLDQARQAGVKRVVYAASSSAYGDQPQPRKSESAVPSPLSPYAAAKLAGESYCQAFYHSYGLETVCLRYFNVFGPRQDPNGPYAAVIPQFITKLIAGERPKIFGDGRQTRDFCYVENVAQANLLAAEVPAAAGKVFNVGNGERTSLLDLFRDLKELLKSPIEPDFQPARAGDVRDSLSDLTQIQTVLGYKPAISFKEGLRRTVEAYRAAAA